MSKLQQRPLTGPTHSRGARAAGGRCDAQAAIGQLVARAVRSPSRQTAWPSTVLDEPPSLSATLELERRITHLREQQQRATLPIPPGDPDAPSSVMRALTLQIAALKRRHRDEVAQLRQDLAAAHGEILALRCRLGEQRR